MNIEKKSEEKLISFLPGESKIVCWKPEKKSPAALEKSKQETNGLSLG
jgi:hypothetical protein